MTTPDRSRPTVAQRLLLPALVAVSVLAAGLHLLVAAGLVLAHAVLGLPDGPGAAGGPASAPTLRLVLHAALAVLALGAGLAGVVRATTRARLVALVVCVVVLLALVVEMTTAALVDPLPM